MAWIKSRQNRQPRISWTNPINGGNQNGDVAMRDGHVDGPNSPQGESDGHGRGRTGTLAGPAKRRTA
ncbi:hypothetical protein E2562_038969 [Oryza meyeriana var. granulata]|uniref:Uncharacterized protein n=1 Tax=Oryza meyeriana var. granulata TaxID=110450 RepID=A0A6G1ECS1_9ORYZ|nr:hypothetical protein E2562_038969 [Oryza meyeriana var. granulata]